MLSSVTWKTFLDSGIDGMSERTSKATRAVRLAWKNEQKLVCDGQGTRDWTPEQQKDILEDGVAYDENGVVFRGHHMQSVELFPQFQGEPGNIQFLSAEEHLKAHRGWFRNLTNWYYNPATGKEEPFENDIFRPCKIVYLSDPVVRNKEIEIDAAEITDSSEETSEKNTQNTDNKTPGEPVPEKTSSPSQEQVDDSEQSHKEKMEDDTTPNQVPRLQQSTADAQKNHLAESIKARPVVVSESPVGTPSKTRQQGLIGEIRRIWRGYLEWRNRNDYWIAQTKHALREQLWKGGSQLLQQRLEAESDAMFEAAMKQRANSGIVHPDQQNEIESDVNDDNDSSTSINTDLPDDELPGAKRASPREHTVKEHGQHYLKGGERVWIPKKPYPRGGKKDDDDKKC